MRSLTRVRLLVAFQTLALTLLLLLGTEANGQGKNGGGKSVTFTTNDGVSLSGTLYAGGGKKEASVILLHNFDSKKGGSSGEEGWAHLAQTLQNEGYTVLSFDFRGFGDSKKVDASFWLRPHNRNLVTKRKMGETIEYKDFKNTQYIPYLTYDIAAAKAYLDRQNDQRVGNTSNTIVIGAGQGATIGALWVASECRRHRDTQPLPLGLPMLTTEPEGKDVACCVWLSMAKLGLAGNNLNRYITEAGKDHKIPMVFLYGKSDSASGGVANSLAGLIKPPGSKEKSLTYAAGINTSLAANKLLSPKLDTVAGIRKYLDQVMDARGNRERTERNVEKSRYYYSSPKKGVLPELNKNSGEMAPPVKVQMFIPALVN